MINEYLFSHIVHHAGLEIMQELDGVVVLQMEASFAQFAEQFGSSGVFGGRDPLQVACPVVGRYAVDMVALIPIGTRSVEGGADEGVASRIADEICHLMISPRAS